MIQLAAIKKEIETLPLNKFGCPSVKDVDLIIKRLQKEKEEAEYDESLLKNNVFLQRVFFSVNLKPIKKDSEKFLYIDKYKHLFYGWECTDMLIGYAKNIDFDYLLKYAIRYVKSENTYDRRWGYVMFMTNGFKKDENKIKKLLPLLKEDKEETVRMAQAWLLCEMAIFHPQVIYDYLHSKHLPYSITGKAVSKIHDSFRISEEWKNKFKEIRNLY